MKNRTITFLSFLAFCSSAWAQDTQRTNFPYSNRLTLGGGVSQLLLGGFNVQSEYTTKCMVFDYSHGFNIRLSGQAASLVAQNR
ncbi:hypothetical protein GGR92_004314 [Spirosoma lacussanchae]|uniref:hypothetical protein n=1 Tax=Spirosoma lacussanchae TaxID=1884249 RepID=UPI001108C881|nr:hypothetical protein [Spirosoma lacussanchae]